MGHVDGDTGAPGEFAALYDVRPGARVEVRRAGAEPAVYRVGSRSTVAKVGLPSSTFRRTGPPGSHTHHLRAPVRPRRGWLLGQPGRHGGAPA
ncbi:hypothetical protein [Streptomyces chryseus]|uniref:hypothetical protein n=1 Tax=Streptomyces chryseus TaxID=68186 RepID=UPI003570EBA8